MASIEIRTEDELKRAQWAEKYLSVAEGKLYTGDELSPFPNHEYLRLKSMGKHARMLEMNAGHALVEHMVADAMTEMKITVGEGDETAEQEISDWMAEEDYEEKLEEAARNLFAAGYVVHQPFRIPEGVDSNRITGFNINPATWYPDTPTLLYEKVTSGRIICVFPVKKDYSVTWYAFVERHEIGKLTYELYKLEHAQETKGALVPLGTLERFAGLKDVVQTGLDTLAVFQQNRTKRSDDIVGQSILLPIWGPLQEVSEIQTQIRQERIKHFRSKLAAPSRSLQRAQPRESVPEDKFALPLDPELKGPQYNANQEVFPIPEGSTVLPQYIQWDMAIIEAGSNEIDKLHNRMASYTGFPRSVFNLDEKGETHVDTEKRKNVRYVRKVIQGQRRIERLMRDVLLTRYKWMKKEATKIKVELENPFQLSQQEVAEMMHEMNPGATLVSQSEAIRQVWKGMDPAEREKMESEIEDEQQMKEPPPNSFLNNANPTL